MIIQLDGLMGATRKTKKIAAPISHMESNSVGVRRKSVLRASPL